MTFFSVDIEADGPAPGLYSMLSIGLVAVRPDLDDRFYCELKPISDDFVPSALEVSGLDRRRLAEEGAEPAQAMARLRRFLADASRGRPVFISDNPGFDFAFVNYYLHAFGPDRSAGGDEAEADPNPFGHSSRRIGDLWAGLVGDASRSSDWKELRRTGHTHNALDDAVGNAEALLAFQPRGLNIDFL